MGVVAGEYVEVAGGEVADVGVGKFFDVDGGGVFGEDDVVCVARDWNSFAAELTQRFAEWVACGGFWTVRPEELEEASAGDGLAAFDDEIGGDAEQGAGAL